MIRDEEVPDGNATGGCVAWDTEPEAARCPHCPHPCGDWGTLRFGLDVLYMTYETPGFVLEPAFLRIACRVTLIPTCMLTHPHTYICDIFQYIRILSMGSGIFHGNVIGSVSLNIFLTVKTHQLASLSK